MVKPFGKQTYDWTRLKNTNHFLTALEGAKGIPRGAMYMIVNDGFNNGTWMHDDEKLLVSKTY